MFTAEVEPVEVSPKILPALQFLYVKDNFPPIYTVSDNEVIAVPKDPSDGKRV